MSADTPWKRGIHPLGAGYCVFRRHNGQIEHHLSRVGCAPTIMSFTTKADADSAAATLNAQGQVDTVIKVDETLKAAGLPSYAELASLLKEALPYINADVNDPDGIVTRITKTLRAVEWPTRLADDAPDEAAEAPRGEGA